MVVGVEGGDAVVLGVGASMRVCTSTAAIGRGQPGCACVRDKGGDRVRLFSWRYFFHPK